MENPLIVAPSKIELELSHIWESLSKGASRKMRATLFNLILVTDKNKREAYIRGLAKRIIEKFPSRILFVTIDRESKEDSLVTKVSVLSPLLGDKEEMSDIACDMIECEVTSASVVRVPFVLLSHLLPDLPVYLLWAEDPILDNPLSYQLERFSTRLIFDSEATSNLPLFAKSLLHHYKTSGAEIADLNWARTESWRTLLAATFHSKERVDELSDARTLKLTYNAKVTDFFCHTRIQSIYLQGWLAKRLKWTLRECEASSGEIFFHYETPKNLPVEVHLIPQDAPEMAPGSLASFELNTYGGEHFLFARNPEASYQITLFISSREKCLMPTQFLFSKGGIGQTLVKEIGQKDTSEHYLELLEFIAGLEALALC
jgi:hypothetical protein